MTIFLKIVEMLREKVFDYACGVRAGINPAPTAKPVKPVKPAKPAKPA